MSQVKGPGGGESIFLTEPVDKSWRVHGGMEESQVRLEGSAGSSSCGQMAGDSGH